MGADTKEKPFGCFCGRSFARNDLLKRHRQRAHTNLNTSVEDANPKEQNAGAGAPNSQSQGVARQGAPGDTHEEPHAALSPVQSFAAFMESIGLAPDWYSLDFFDVGPTFQQSEGLGTFQFDGPQLPPLENLGRPEASLDVQPPSSSSGGRSSAPTTAELSAVAEKAGSESALTPIDWKLTDSQWQTLAQASQESVPGFTLPSRPAISRYLKSYAAKFHKHYPFVHLPSFCPASSPLCLSLAMAAVGAQCVFEFKNGLRLYHAAKSLTLEHRHLASADQSHNRSDLQRTTMIQCLVLLMVYSAWDTDAELLNDALELQSISAEYMRSSLRDGPPFNDVVSEWKQWIREETRRRVIQISYGYLMVQSTYYDLPPVILNSEIQELQLPCGSTEWEARTEDEWREALRHSRYTPAHVVDALRQVLHQPNDGAVPVLRFSAMGSFVVLQALIQRIFFARQLHDTAKTALPRAELDVLQ